MGPEVIGNLAIYFVVLLFAISAHEAAHALMSYKFGDDTAYLLGRITMNPISHMDPIGTVLIPIANFLITASGGQTFLIGWGKPTPVNPLRWRNKNVANVMVSLAGILANLTIAFLALVIFKICLKTGVLDFSGVVSIAKPIALLIYQTLMMNASLAVFNLLPFPPLDGSKVLETFLPRDMQPMLETLAMYSFLILPILMYLGVFSFIFAPVARFIHYLLLL